MTALSEIYNSRIIELAAAIPRAERLAAPDATASAHSKLCGSTITVDMKLRDGRVSEFGQLVKACLLGQAAASVMGREVVGSTPVELKAVGTAMRRMLKEGGEPPAGRWADLAVLSAEGQTLASWHGGTPFYAGVTVPALVPRPWSCGVTGHYFTATKSDEQGWQHG